MKNHIVIAAAMLLLAACTPRYLVVDHVGTSLDGTRTVYVSDSNTLGCAPYRYWQFTALEQGMAIDFRDQVDTMRYSYSQTMTRDGWTVAGDSVPRVLQPQVSLTKNFRWFTTRYRYTAVFPALDSMPVPIGKYLSPDEQRLLFQSLDQPADWNGADMYALLDKLNTKYVKWLSHCLFEREMDAYIAYCDSAQQALLSKYRDTLLTLVFASLPGEFKSISNVSTSFPELEFINKINDIGFDALKKAYEQWELGSRVLWRVELPGKRVVETMVSTERLIEDDYVVTLDSHVLNWWAIAITLLPILAIIFWAPASHRLARR